jgi:ADP-heptose:LPS heptosyltransferase
VEKGLGTALPSPANDVVHETEAILQLGAPLGITGTPGAVHVYPDDRKVAAWRARLPAGPKHWVALHISARQARRHWPVERFVELARSLSRDPAVGIALLYSPGPANDPRHPGDDERAAQIVAAMGPEVTLLPARTESLADLIAVLSVCHSFIGPDGGAMHIAAGVGLPMVALFENLPDKKRHWHPWGVPHVMVSPEGLDVVDLPVAAVADAWQGLIAGLPR